MKFLLSSTYAYWWPVTVNVPDPKNAGKIAKQKFRVKFEAEDQDAALAAEEEREMLITEKDKILFERQRLMAKVKDWDEIEDGENSPVPFSDAALEAALKWPWFRAALYNAYNESIVGQEAKLGN